MGDRQGKDRAASPPNRKVQPYDPDLEATVLGAQDTESSIGSSQPAVDTNWIGNRSANSK